MDQGNICEEENANERKTLIPNDFEFHISQIVRQIDNLKADIKYDMVNLKADILNGLKTRDSYLNQTKDNIYEDLEKHGTEIESLKKAKWYAIGAAGLMMFIFEIGLRAFDYWMVKSGG